MDTNLLGTKFITQIGILVHDIDKTSQAYADFFGVETSTGKGLIILRSSSKE